MLPHSRFIDVVSTLRVAGAHFSERARICRAERRPTHHAKRRAIRLNLNVDTQRAAELHISAVSQRPYPEVVQTYSPVAVDSSKYMPTTCRATGPTANDLVNMNAALLHHMARNPEPLREDSQDRLMYPPSGYEAYPVVHWPEPDVSSEAYGNCGTLPVHSASTSRSSSVVITPEDRQSMPLKIRINIKRKSSEVEDNGSYIEKRPKYGRKHWIATLRGDDVRSRNV